MKKITVEVSGEIEVQYDENSTEFQEALASYNEVISEGSAEDMVLHAVSQLKSFGDHYNMVEGVGYIGLIGQPIPEKLYSGIQVSNNYGDLYYTVQ